MECRYCFGDVNPKAQKCQHCGEWVNKISSKNQGVVDTFINSKDLGTTVNSGIKLYAGFQVIGVVIGFILFISFSIFIFTQMNKMDRRHDNMFPKFETPKNSPEAEEFLKYLNEQENKNQ
jgi:predicted PurR-regulated permease PerM